MLSTKFVVEPFLFIAATILSCSETEEPVFELTNANISGTYNIEKINIQTEETATASSGAVVTFLQLLLLEILSMTLICNQC